MAPSIPLPEEPKVYVRVAGFLAMKLRVGEILQYLVWYEEGHRPLYVKCPECGCSWVCRVETGQEDALWKGQLQANCPHADQVCFSLHLGENSHPLQDHWLVSALRDVHPHRTYEFEFNTNELFDRKITDFCGNSSLTHGEDD